ncbi:MAG: hypothetical protein ACW98Y_07355 [Candidatus Thorarchaeota archaeon]|jgi:hypothetical protein
MTTQSQVEEQVIAEWLSMDGYFVETNIGLSALKKGGRGEADIVAVKVEGGHVIVRHVEIGQLGQNYETNLSHVQDKFHKKNRTDIKEFVKERMSLTEEFEWDYKCEYVFTYVASRQIQKLMEALAKDDIELVSFDMLLRDEIPKTMRKWREKEIESGRIAGKDWTYVMLPRKYRILFIVDRVIELFDLYT